MTADEAKQLSEKIDKAIDVNKLFIKEEGLAIERYWFLFGRIEAYEHAKDIVIGTFKGIVE